MPISTAYILKYVEQYLGAPVVCLVIQTNEGRVNQMMRT